MLCKIIVGALATIFIVLGFTGFVMSIVNGNDTNTDIDRITCTMYDDFATSYYYLNEVCEIADGDSVHICGQLADICSSYRDLEDKLLKKYGVGDCSGI